MTDQVPGSPKGRLVVGAGITSVAARPSCWATSATSREGKVREGKNGLVALKDPQLTRKQTWVAGVRKRPAIWRSAAGKSKCWRRCRLGNMAGESLANDRDLEKVPCMEETVSGRGSWRQR
jgi:hypothetical protein